MVTCCIEATYWLCWKVDMVVVLYFTTLRSHCGSNTSSTILEVRIFLLIGWRVEHPDQYTVTSILPFPSFLYPHVYKEPQALALRGGNRLQRSSFQLRSRPPIQLNPGWAGPPQHVEMMVITVTNRQQDGLRKQVSSQPINHGNAPKSCSLNYPARVC